MLGRIVGVSSPKMQIHFELVLKNSSISSESNLFRIRNGYSQKSSALADCGLLSDFQYSDYLSDSSQGWFL